jgi:hypothetical protein
LIALFFDYNGPAIKNQGVGNLWAIEQSLLVRQIKSHRLFIEQIISRQRQVSRCREMIWASLRNKN